ncbi:MAG TPA: cyclase family protein [bacterium]
MTAPQIIDLTYPITSHFRWKVDREQVGRMEDGAEFQVMRISMAVHSFTHIDSPRHMVPGGPTTSDVRLEQLVGLAKLIDLTGIAPQTPIPPEHLKPKGGHVERGDIVLPRTAWDTPQSLDTPEFWSASPYPYARGLPVAAGAGHPSDGLRLSAGLSDPATAEGGRSGASPSSSATTCCCATA